MSGSGAPAGVNVWQAAKDPDTGDLYYYNTETDETTWDKPVGATIIPPDSDSDEEDITPAKKEQKCHLPINSCPMGC